MAVSSLEVLRNGKESRSGAELLRALIDAARHQRIETYATQSYQGQCDWLALYGVGAQDRARARNDQLAQGRHALLWDHGYFSRAKAHGYMRVSIDHQHPQAWLDRTEPRGERWETHGLKLREDANKHGHIVLAGCGPKSHTFLGTHGWEAQKLRELRQRYPHRRIVYRPKPNRPALDLGCESDSASPIEAVLRDAALVVCRHSNVAVDAVVAGVPFECEDGAAFWLKGKPYTRAARLDFVQRLSWWQWLPDEMPAFLKFLGEVTAK